NPPPRTETSGCYASLLLLEARPPRQSNPYEFPPGGGAPTPHRTDGAHTGRLLMPCELLLHLKNDPASDCLDRQMQLRLDRQLKEVTTQQPRRKKQHFQVFHFSRARIQARNHVVA